MGHIDGTAISTSAPITYPNGLTTCTIDTQPSEPPVVTTEESGSSGLSSSSKLLLYLVVFLCLGLFAALGLLFCQRRRRQEKAHDFSKEVGDLHEFRDTKLPREIKRSCVKTLDRLGDGAYEKKDDKEEKKKEEEVEKLSLMFSFSLIFFRPFLLLVSGYFGDVWKVCLNNPRKLTHIHTYTCMLL